MTKNFYERRTALGLALTMFFPCLLPAQKATTSTPVPVALPQYASITSTDNTIQVSRMPIIDNGNIAYVDVTLAVTFGVDAAGHPTVEIVPPVVTSSPTLLVNNFKAGTYVGPGNLQNGNTAITVNGPAAQPGGGSAWTLAETASSAGTYPSAAIWYAEPAASNPLASRIGNAKITAQTASAYSFGYGDSALDENSNWPVNALLGFSQVGNTLSISSFSYLGDNCPNNTCDQSTPTETITYTLQQ